MHEHVEVWMWGLYIPHGQVRGGGSGGSGGG